jgi:hypothetical protein
MVQQRYSRAEFGENGRILAAGSGSLNPVEFPTGRGAIRTSIASSIQVREKTAIAVQYRDTGTATWRDAVGEASSESFKLPGWPAYSGPRRNTKLALASLQ